MLGIHLTFQQLLLLNLQLKNDDRNQINIFGVFDQVILTDLFSFYLQSY